jgi:hypothetical protein
MRVSDDVPNDILAIAKLMPAMDFELAQALRYLTSHLGVGKKLATLVYPGGELCSQPDTLQ